MPSESKINQWETKSQQSQIQKKEADKTTHCRLQQQKWKNYESETGLSEGYRWWTLNQAAYENGTASGKRDKTPSANPTYSDDVAETWPVRITERREKSPLYAALFKK